MGIVRIITWGYSYRNPALTTRGFKEPDFEKVAEYLIRALKIAQRCQTEAGSKKLKDFIPIIKKDVELQNLKNEVERFALSFAY